MHGIRAVRRDSGNKDQSSRKAARVFFMGDRGWRVPACSGASVRVPRLLPVGGANVPAAVRLLGDHEHLGGDEQLLQRADPEGNYCWNNEARFGGRQDCLDHQAAFR